MNRCWTRSKGIMRYSLQPALRTWCMRFALPQPQKTWRTQVLLGNMILITIVAADSIGLMVKKCWASLWSNAAFSYRHTQGIEHRTVYMAVVVQEMVRSDVSGVTFTAGPVSGNNSVIITESSWGMGAAIVDGRVSPDQ